MTDDQTAEPLLAICSAEEEGPFTIRVVAPDGKADLVYLEYPWENFRPASAGHRLIEHGYMVVPERHFMADRVAGWQPAPGMDWSQAEPGSRRQEWHNYVQPIEG